jgi:hypothetical protein
MPAAAGRPVPAAIVLKDQPLVETGVKKHFALLAALFHEL